SELIAYGGDHTQRKVSEERQQEILNKYGVKPNDYSISVCRIEPENNSHILCEAFAKSGKDLVFVGNWNHCDYSRNLKKRYSSYRNIHLVDSVYDLDELYALRNQCECYIHGHSAGGTNPSLVEAMSFGKPIIAFDVVYNRETTGNKAYYFKNCKELIERLHEDKDGTPMKEIAQTHYTWKTITGQYEQLY
ncbi:glycosyltransferase family 1 protein, partial [Akkermansia sp. BIOML-A63]